MQQGQGLLMNILCSESTAVQTYIFHLCVYTHLEVMHVKGDDADDCFYIVLFFTLKQTRCARM